MKKLALLGCVLGITAAPVLAQRGGMRGGGFGGFRGGGFRGGISIGRGGHFGGRFGHFSIRTGVRGLRRFDQFNFERRLGLFNRGFGGFYGGFGYGNYSPYVYAWPTYVGGYYDTFDPFYSSYYSYPAYPMVTVVNPQSAEPAPPVVVTQQFTPAPAKIIEVPQEEPQAQQQAQQQAEEPRQLPSSGPVLYLIAMKSGVIHAALAYWVDHGTLHYLGMDHQRHTAALDTVDRPLSERLNRERRVPFRLQ